MFRWLKVQWLRSRLASTNWHVRAKAARQLGRLKDHRAVQLMAARLESCDASGALEAAHVLLEFGTPEAMDVLWRAICRPGERSFARTVGWDFCRRVVRNIDVNSRSPLDGPDRAWHAALSGDPNKAVYEGAVAIDALAAAIELANDRSLQERAIGCIEQLADPRAIESLLVLRRKWADVNIMEYNAMRGLLFATASRMSLRALREDRNAQAVGYLLGLVRSLNGSGCNETARGQPLVDAIAEFLETEATCVAANDLAKISDLNVEGTFPCRELIETRYDGDFPMDRWEQQDLPWSLDTSHARKLAERELRRRARV